MADETAGSNTNFRAAIIIIIVFMAILGLAFIFLIQGKNQASQTSDSTTGTEATTATTTSDAGSLGKNEVGLTDANFAAEVEKSQGIFLVEFYLSTCPHCQNVAKDVAAAASDMAGEAKVGKIEASDNKNTADKYNVTGVPTFIVFKNGKEVDRAEGEMTKQQLLDLINKQLK